MPRAFYEKERGQIEAHQAADRKALEEPFRRWMRGDPSSPDLSAAWPTIGA